jgi:hypothetical protein
MYGIPTCNCAIFTSSLIPCPHICKVFGRIPDELFDDKNLHPRWGLSSHPLYPQALAKSSLCDFSAAPVQPITTTNQNDRDLIQTHLDRSVYDSIVFPSKGDVRYSKLNQEFNKIEGKVINSEHYYKLMMINLAAYNKHMQNAGPPSFFLLPDPPLSSPKNQITPLSIAVRPPNKRGRSSKEDTNG